MFLLKCFHFRQETKERIAVVKIQKRARIYICHQINKRRHRAVNKIQGFVKMQWLSFLFQVLRKSVKKIQVKICFIFLNFFTIYFYIFIESSEAFSFDTEENE